MVKTAEQKARDRYRAELLAGKTPRTYTETNRKILEEIRAGAIRIHSAKQEAVSAIDAATRQALREIASASSSGSGVTPAAQETPLIQAVAQEARGPGLQWAGANNRAREPPRSAAWATSGILPASAGSADARRPKAATAGA